MTMELSTLIKQGQSHSVATAIRIGCMGQVSCFGSPEKWIQSLSRKTQVNTEVRYSWVVYLTTLSVAQAVQNKTKYALDKCTKMLEVLFTLHHVRWRQQENQEKTNTHSGIKCKNDAECNCYNAIQGHYSNNSVQYYSCNYEMTEATDRQTDIWVHNLFLAHARAWKTCKMDIRRNSMWRCGLDSQYQVGA
jgi:hypothetical protein